MQLDEGVHQQVAAAGRVDRVEVGEQRRLVQHHAVDEPHEVERRAEDVLVPAQDDGVGDRHGGRPEGADDGVLADHVVGGREHAGERRTP